MPAEGDYPLPASGALVTVPTYDGSGSSTHPSAVDMGRRWNGYRWWFADTPYHNEDVSLENPSIFASNDRASWVVPAGVSNPIAPDPDSGGPGYNSDVELVWDPDESRLVCYWRDYIPSRSPVMLLKVKTSPDGITWTDGTETILGQPLETFSPTIYRAGVGDWRLWQFGYGNPPKMWTAPASVGPWTLAATCNVGGVSNWHGDIIKHEGRWIGTFSNKNYMRPMASTDDGVTWTVGALMEPASYRPTMLPSTEAGQIDVWTSRMARVVNYYRYSDTLWLDL